MGNQLSSPPDVVTVFFGANDAALPAPDGEHFHVPLPQYKANLHQIVSHIKVKATPTHPSCPTSINCSRSIFQKELVLGRRVGAKLLASIDEFLCTDPKRFFKNVISLPLSAARYKLTDFISLLGIVNTFVCLILWVACTCQHICVSYHSLYDDLADYKGYCFNG
jgi:hypothetical protein